MAGRRCRGLSSDIITGEILPRLPVKTLCKFRCVSKSWYRLLLSDPDFLRLHWRRSEQNPTLLVITPDYNTNRIPFFTMKTDVEHGERRVAGSGRSAADLGLDMRDLRKDVSACHGLVLLSSRYVIRIWNPATGEWTDIKVPVRRRRKDVVATIGYAESTGEYKVLVFYTDTGTSCEVLTVGGSGGWRATKTPPPFRLLFSTHGMCNIAVVNGFVHLLSLSPFGGIARFDLEAEDWSVIPGVHPCRRAPMSEYYYCLLREVNGFLCWVQFSECRRRADIWLLKGVWVKEYTIDISYNSYLAMRGYIVEPLMIEEDGRILFTSRGLHLLFYYDPKSESFQEIYRFQECKWGYKEKFPCMLSTLYAESFASFKSGKIGHIGRCLKRGKTGHIGRCPPV